MKQGDHKGWISIHRKLLKHWLWQDKPFSQGQAWIDILLECNHEENEVVIKNTVFICKRSESLNSLQTWSKRFGWNVSATRRFIKKLEKANTIRIANESLTTRLTVCNYDTYQIKRIADESQMNRKRIASESQVNTNNKKTSKQVNKELYGELSYFEDSDFQEVWREFLEVRRKRKTTTSDRAMKKIVNDLLKFAQNKEEAIEIVANSATSGYPNLYPLKINSKNDFIVYPMKPTT